MATISQGSKKKVQKFGKKERRFLTLARALARTSSVIVIEGNCEEYGKEVEKCLLEKIRAEFSESTIIYLVEKKDDLITGFTDLFY